MMENKLYKRQRGVTLIALVVTILILIILAGISINATLGENGLITKANEAKKLTEKSQEKEILELKIAEDVMSDGEEENIGVRLYDKTMENATIWDIIVTKDPNKTYGTNWNYIPKGTEIKEYGKTKNEWLVNYETGEIISLEDKEYTRLTHGMNLGVTEGLILNIDPSIIEDANIDSIKNGDTSILGDNVELKNFNWKEDSGLTSTSFNFDGVDDYIKIKYDDDTEKEQLANNGFTFEYYGTLDEGTSYNTDGTIIEEMFKGIFCYWNGIESSQARFRFGIDKLIGNSPAFRLKWTAGGLSGVISDYMQSKTTTWNIVYPIEDFEYGNEIYYTITLDTTTSYEKDGEEFYNAILYLNGEKKYEGGYNKKQWDDFVNNKIDELKYFCVGRCSMNAEGQWHYSKMNAYTLRLYNKALTEEQVKDNYDKSVAYHESITSKN